jgi:hypothetical protein
MNNTLDVAVVREGAAFPGVCSPWTTLPVLGTSYVLMPDHALAVYGPDARLAAFRQIPALTEHATALAAVLPSVTDIRKQFTHKTRVNAGGDGASGPHPEREPA